MSALSDFSRSHLLQAKLKTALQMFAQQKTVFAAQHLREKVVPGSELFGHYEASDGRWIAELRYDHLIHEAEGPTLADAIVNAVKQVVDVLSINPDPLNAGRWSDWPQPPETSH